MSYFPQRNSSSGFRQASIVPDKEERLRLDSVNMMMGHSIFPHSLGIIGSEQEEEIFES